MRDGGDIEFQRFVDKPQTGRVSSLRYGVSGADAVPLSLLKTQLGRVTEAKLSASNERIRMEVALNVTRTRQ